MNINIYIIYILSVSTCFPRWHWVLSTLGPPECSLSSHGAHMQSFWSTGSQPSSVCSGVGSCSMALGASSYFQHEIKILSSHHPVIFARIILYIYIVFSIYKGEFHANDLIPSPVFRTFRPTICWSLPSLWRCRWRCRNWWNSPDLQNLRAADQPWSAMISHGYLKTNGS